MCKHFYHVSSVWGLVLLCCACCGCGAGAYEKRLKARIEEIKQEAVAGLQKVQLPEAQALVYVPEGLKLQPSDPARRGKPPLPIFNDAGLPTLKYTCEASTPPDQNGDKHQYYCYIGVADPGVAASVDALIGAMQQKLQEKYAGKTGNAADVRCRTIDGQEITCKQLLMDDLPQEFTYKGKNKLPGTVDIYLREINGCVVVIAWRVPSHLKDYIQLSTLGPRVAGTVGKEG